MVIIGLRSDSKLATRNLILTKTAVLLDNFGYLKLSSKEIARECNLSQGSIFLHFETKENLLNTILTSKIDNLEEELVKKCDPKKSIDIFLKNYLDIISANESFLSRVYKDFPYLSDVLKKTITNLEATIKNLFFENLRNDSKNKNNIIDTFISIDAFFAQIQKNLLEKEIYNDVNNVIKQKRGKLLKLHRTLFKQE